MNWFILGTDLTLGPVTARTGDTESDLETTVPTPGTGRGSGRGTGSGKGARGTGSGTTTGSGVEVGIEEHTMTDIETGTGLSWRICRERLI